MDRPDVVEWLLEPDQPSIRFQALTDLQDERPGGAAARSARSQIASVGFGPAILEGQSSDGWWVGPESTYTPKYLSTNWRLLVLADLGLTKAAPPVRRAADLLLSRQAKSDGGFGSDGSSRSHYCIVGNTTRAALQLGYGDDPRVKSALDWLVRAADPKGGWSCWGMGRNLDSWEALSAFAALPRAQRSGEMEECVRKGVGFFLERELHRQGEPYPPWMRFHDPVHYYYDLLVGLDLVTALGYGADPRLRFALAHLRRRRRRDGRWSLDAAHPDVSGGMAAWFRSHPRHRPTPLLLETVGAPSKRITLKALRVLRRVAEADPSDRLPT